MLHRGIDFYPARRNVTPTLHGLTGANHRLQTRTSGTFALCCRCAYGDIWQGQPSEEQGCRPDYLAVLPLPKGKESMRMRKFGLERLRRRTAVVVVAPLLLIGGSVGFLSGPASATTPTLQNGSFETGNYVDGGSGFDTLFAGSTDMTGWTVTAGSVDWISTYWVAADGSRSLDMNGDSPGGVRR